MAGAIKPNTIYTVDFGNTTFQVRTIRRNTSIPRLWECVSLFSRRELVLPERAFIAELSSLDAVRAASLIGRPMTRTRDVAA